MEKNFASQIDMNNKPMHLNQFAVDLDITTENVL